LLSNGAGDPARGQWMCVIGADEARLYILGVLYLHRVQKNAVNFCCKVLGPRNPPHDTSGEIVYCDINVFRRMPVVVAATAAELYNFARNGHFATAEPLRALQYGGTCCVPFEVSCGKTAAIGVLGE
jgi:hypothetical protein